MRGGDPETVDHIFMYCESQEEHNKLSRLKYLNWDLLLLTPPN